MLKLDFIQQGSILDPFMIFFETIIYIKIKNGPKKHIVLYYPTGFI